MQDARPDGYLALPVEGKGSPVLVLHAWWGLNETMRAFCRRLSGSGFVAFAPDLYHGKVVDTIADAESMIDALDPGRAKTEVADAAAFVIERAGVAGHGLAAIGFSMGANLALDLSVTDPERVRSVVLFYGTGPGDFERSRASYLGHFAEKDPFEPRSDVDELEAALRHAGRPVTFHHYSGARHWFFEPDRSDAYNPAAAALALDRTVAFLQQPSPL